VLRQRRQTVAEANDSLVPVGAVSASVDCPGSCYLATPKVRPDADQDDHSCDGRGQMCVPVVNRNEGAVSGNQRQCARSSADAGAVPAVSASLVEIRSSMADGSDLIGT